MLKNYKIISLDHSYLIFPSPAETYEIYLLRYTQPFPFGSREGEQHLY